MESLVGLIYETVAEPGLWDAVVRKIETEVGASSSWMLQPGPAGPTYFALNGISETVVQDYVAHYHSRDILVQEGFRRRHEFAGRAVRERDLVGEDAWLRSEIYNELGVPNEVGQILTAPLMAMPRPDCAPPFLSFFRAPRAPLFPDESVAYLQSLVPHLGRAVRLRQGIAGQLAPVPGWTAALLETLPFGVLLLDGKARLAYANEKARSILKARDGLSLQHGKPVARGNDAARQFASSIALSLGRTPRGSELLVPRLDARSWIVSVSPLSAFSGEAFGGVALRCCVLIADPDAGSPTGKRLARLFGLSAAEGRVAAGLLNGHSASEIAEMHRVSVATVRTQIQAIFAQLGVRRQSELMKLMQAAAVLPGREK